MINRAAFSTNSHISSDIWHRSEIQDTFLILNVSSSLWESLSLVWKISCICMLNVILRGFASSVGENNALQYCVTPKKSN